MITFGTLSSLNVFWAGRIVRVPYYGNLFSVQSVGSDDIVGLWRNEMQGATKEEYEQAVLEYELQR